MEKSINFHALQQRLDIFQHDVLLLLKLPIAKHYAAKLKILQGLNNKKSHMFRKISIKPSWKKSNPMKLQLTLFLNQEINIVKSKSVFNNLKIKKCNFERQLYVFLNLQFF